LENYRNKIKDLSSLLQIIKKYKNKKIVFTNGCFDILHLGHIRYLYEARQLGDILIVGVNDDDSVKRLKGNNRPIMNIAERSELLAALCFVDYVIIFFEDTPYEIINNILPDIIVKGGDYEKNGVVGKEIVEKKHGKVIILPFYANYSSSNIINKIIKKYG